MDEMIKIEMPVEEWIKMERKHEIVEDFLMSIDVIGLDNAKVHLLDKLDELYEEEQG